MSGRSWRGGFSSSTVRSIGRTLGFNLFSTLAAGLGGIIVARLLGPAGRGEYATVMSWLGVALVVGEIGQTAAVVYFSARDVDRAPDVLATGARIMKISGAGAFLVALAVAGAHGFGTQGFWTYLNVALILPISFVSAPFIFALQATRISTWNWVRSVQPLIWLVALLVSWSFHLTVALALAFVLISTVLQAAAAWWACRRHGLVGGTPDASLTRPLVRYGLTNLASLLPTSLLRQVDIIMLGALAAATSVGLYSVAMSYVSLAAPLSAAIGSVLFPAQARAKSHSLAQIRRYLAWSSGAAVVAGIGLTALSPWLLTFMYSNAYREALPLVFLLLPTLLASSVNQVGGDLLRGQGHPRIAANSAWVGLGVMVVLLVALVPRWGAAGACAAAGVAQCGALVVLLRGLWKLNRVDAFSATM